jgi:hypothetical protein
MSRKHVWLYGVRIGQTEAMQLRLGRDFIEHAKADDEKVDSRGHGERLAARLRRWEILFFIVGAIALGTFGVVKAYSWIYQHYADYFF